MVVWTTALSSMSRMAMRSMVVSVRSSRMVMAMTISVWSVLMIRRVILRVILRVLLLRVMAVYSAWKTAMTRI